MIIPIFLPHLGCQSRCIYCDQDVITDIEKDDIGTRIDESLAGRKGPLEVGLYGGNIFGLNSEDVKRLFSYFRSHEDKITNFRVSTKPIPLDPEVIAILRENRATVIELGIPAFNDHILGFLNRRHTTADLINAFSMLTGEGFQVALQVMVGLPHETLDDVRETVRNIVKLKPSYIRIYPLAFISGTPLAAMHEAGAFTAITFEETLQRTVLIYLNALQHGIKTVKMGLTDNEVIKDRIVGGYYHPAFGFLVKSQAFHQALMARVIEGGFTGYATVCLNSRDISHFLGYKRTNLARFREAGLSVTWEAANIAPGTFILKTGKKKIWGTIFDALSELNK
ncbi:MAG TPA: radical SAM protein [Syntrophorhabdus sp.]|nr:radical SAM protein [Syntrophorhabdus sp.]